MSPQPLLPLIFITVLLPLHHAQSTIIAPHCTNQNFYEPNSPYQSNLNHLLSTLISHASTSPKGFYNATFNTVYGLFLCKGDQTPTNCHQCVANAAKQLPTTLCPNDTEAIVWYDDCMLRYSDTNIFSMIDLSNPKMLSNDKIASNITRITDQVNSSMAEISARAAADVSGKKYATKEVPYTQNDIVYNMVQCTPDLSPKDCSACLQYVDRLLYTQSIGSRVLVPSCEARYELYAFYDPKAYVEPPPLPAAGTVYNKATGKKSWKVDIGATVGGAAAALMLLAFVICWVKKKKENKQETTSRISVSGDFISAQSLQYGFSTLAAATNNFSEENKIGEGGFGDVYKGTMPNGKEIAVKRLSQTSCQGVEEFKNEVILVAKLQRKNLVRLFGFCLDGDEKLIVYEYVPNGSLNSFLFGPIRQGQLDWLWRYKVISGVARGLLYLHEDSRLRIIHRDLKASNVLLDADMSPKISDFGMARIFRGDQSQENTNRVVGTFGYMAPEYTMHGQISVKSDVYSFGVLVLEIISGRKNNNFFISGQANDLLSYAWKLWCEGRPLEFVDKRLRDSLSTIEVNKCIHMGLLCVQDGAERRPTMASVVLMLNSNSVALPTPSRPAFFIHSTIDHNSSTERWTNKMTEMSVSNVSLTEIGPR